MNCGEVRRLIGAEPNTRAPQILAHLASCPACAEYQLEMLALEANIRRALESPPLSERGRRPAVSRRVWALAASILVGVVAVLGVWSLRIEDTLAHEVVEHVIAEPQSWTPTDPASQAEIAQVLKKTGLLLDSEPYQIMYARNCWFRGHYVAHFVVRTGQGLATVLILPNESVSRRETFHEDGLFGVLVPAVHGSIAVLAASDSPLDVLATRMGAAVRPASPAG
jgi:hypothetical protein